MPTVVFMPDNCSVTVEPGSTVLDAALAAQAALDAPCGGLGTCGKCRVEMKPSPMEEAGGYNPVKHPSGHRHSGQVLLACQTLVTDDIEVEILDPPVISSMQTTRQGLACTVRIAPHVRKHWIASRNQTEVRAGDLLIACESGDTSKTVYGLAVDIGTTTLVCSLVDLNSGQVAASGADINPQFYLAQDVLSRIRLGSEEDGLRRLNSVVIDAINTLSRQLAADAGISTSRIYEAVFSGNTTMMHLAAGLSPASLGRFPYALKMDGHCLIPAGRLGLDIAGGGQVYFPPAVSGYIGSDIVSGVLGTGLYQKSGAVLFIDIGTNGEMVLITDGAMCATATAAGPALEGMNISCGMRAVSGAVESMQILPGGQIDISVIGEETPLGLCGSGVIDVTSEMVRCGIIEKDGRLVKTPETLPESLRNRLNRQSGHNAFRIWGDLAICQKDIRQIQMAKGAIRAGIETLLQYAGIVAGQLDEIIVAGAFGAHLRVESLINIGLLPACDPGRIRFAGNTSMSGSIALLLDYGLRPMIREQAARIKVLELAGRDGFDRLYIQHMAF